MSEEPADIRRKQGQALTELRREDLELLGEEELSDRIAALAAEIERTKAQIGRKQASRAAADAVFGRRD
jgi:uncharacterized small protein (DUF1192 family)